jgi:hypothetical protein
MNKIYTLTSFLVLYALLFYMPIVQVAAESDRHSFAFSARHTFAVPGAGAAFNTWREYEADLVFIGGFRFLS